VEKDGHRWARCGLCLSEFPAGTFHSCEKKTIPQVETDAHYTASALIAEITDLRAQLAGEKAVNARLQGLLNQATVRIVELQRKG